MSISTELIKFVNQVAGHDNLLQFSTDDLMVIKPCTRQEREFYETSLLYEEFLEWIPECYGSLRASTDSEVQLLNEKLDATSIQPSSQIVLESSQVTQLDEHLCLENILNGFSRPCIVDIKLGYRLYEDTANEAKRKKMIENAKGTTIESLGLRISGMKTFDSKERQYTAYPKQYGRERTKDNFTNSLLSFFYPTHHLDDDIDPNTNLPRHSLRSPAEESDETVPKKALTRKQMEWILEHFMDTVEAIQDFIAKHAELQLVGCSLLLVYEGDAAAAQRVWKRMLEEDRKADQVMSSGGKNNSGDEDEDFDEDGQEQEDTVAPKLCDIRLIDFGRSRWLPERKEQDPSLIKALDNLVTMLNQVIEEGPSSTPS